jgi:parallel beta-helix repeat protein
VTLRAATGIGSGNPLEIVAASVEATTTGGGIGLAAIGDLSIGAGGLSAPGSVALSATGSIRVPSGGAITSGAGVTANKPILWSVLNTADSGVGSLRQVIANANATGVESVASFTGKNLVFTPAAPLPMITTKFTIDGTAHEIVIDGRNTIATGLSLSAGSAGSGIRGITVKGFTGTGIVVDGSTGTTISGCVIQANGNGLSATGNLAATTVVGNTFDRNLSYGIVLSAARGLAVDANTVTSVNSSSSMGLYATGDLTGTKVTSNTFSSGLRGALLDSARNLVFGEAGRGNTLLNNRPVAGSDFAGTGIRAQGNLAGTTVRANTFSGNNYGMAFINAQNLAFGGPAADDRNTIQNSSITAIYVEGNCTGSTATGTAYGPGNATTILRVKGSTGL